LIDNGATNDNQHTQMASSFINDIASALKEFGSNKGYSFPNSDQFYSDMAWAGLEGTIAYNNLSSDDKSRIHNTVLSELTGYDANGNKTEQKGKPSGCN